MHRHEITAEVWVIVNFIMKRKTNYRREIKFRLPLKITVISNAMMRIEQIFLLNI